ncbi:MAG: ATP-dependent protease LonB [Candidatus Micrarchaeota archaeon]|nr:ATP-dependent protease LonB [Candidatus Micrarchaeota archaeon]
MAKQGKKIKMKSVKKESEEIDIPQFKTTAEIKIPEKIIDQIIGQDRAVEIVKKAAAQRRNVLLLGSPGTGKSMLAQGMAELMPAENLKDVLVYPNEFDENNPKVRTVLTYPNGLPPENASEEEKMGQGRKIVLANKMQKLIPKRKGSLSWIITLMIILLVGLLLFQFADLSALSEIEKYSSIIAALILGGLFFLAMWTFASKLSRGIAREEMNEPKLIVDNTGRRTAPFIEATGAKAGALFGDVRHDPLQTGGLGTPAHLRVESGAIHRADMGVLYIDEVGTLNPKSQQDLLTAMQEKKFPITGQSEMSSGALTRTEPVPCDFVLVAAGNLNDLANMHPALRSRIRGYGYEIYLNDTMPDTKENREKLVRFVAQEVKKDGKIPHFTRDAVIEIIKEAKRKAGRKRRLTLRLRELGGLIRAAGDIAKSENSPVTDVQHVLKAKGVAKTIEQQLAHMMIEQKKEYSVLETHGAKIGRVNGLAVIGDGSSGLVMPIVAEVTPASSKFEGKVIATGKLGEIAKEAVDNVSAIIKKHMKRDVTAYDIHIQFLQTYEGVEGDSASISVALAVLSAMEGVAIRQDVAMTGSLSVRGEVLPVGGVTAKVEAAIDAGLKAVIVPKENLDDIVLSEEKRKKIEIISVNNLIEVIQHSIKESKRKERLISELRKELKA